jgi:hypothetical protein
VNWEGEAEGGEEGDEEDEESLLRMEKGEEELELVRDLVIL